MKILLNYLALTMLASAFLGCAGSYRGHNRIQESNINIRGGVFKDMEWEDELRLKRTSFFQGANIHYDVLIGELSKDSPFGNWLGNDKNLLNSCDQFFVIMVYRNQRNSIGHTTVVEQLRSLNRDVVEIPSFRTNFNQHYLSKEMNFKPYLVKALCVKSPEKLGELNLFIPGFKQQNIL